MTQKLNDLDKRFSARSENFRQEFQHLKDPENAFGIRFTAIPEGDEVRLDCVFRNGTVAEEFKEPQPRVFIQEGDHSKRLLRDMRFFSSLIWRGIAHGGARQAPAIGNTKLPVHSYRELHRDGLIEMGFVSDSHYEGDLCLLSDLLFVGFSNLAVWVDRIRNQIPAPTTEYVIETEICTRGGSVIVTGEYAAKCFAIRNGTVFLPETKSSLRHRLSNSREIPELVAWFYHGFWNLFVKYIGAKEVVFTIED